MKGTEQFKATIKAYLDERANTDELFAKSLSNPKKSLDDCIAYIANEVKKSGVCGLDDNDVYCLAVHYYDEPDLKGGTMPNCHIVSNHFVELTEEEKAEARNAALKRLEQEQYQALKRPKKTKPVETNTNQPSLFDF